MSLSVALVQTQEKTDILSRARQVLDLEVQGIQRLMDQLDTRFELAIKILETCKGRVVVTGMGKSGIIGRKIAATFSSTGTPAYFLHPGEGMHGDLGMLMKGDVVLAISNSGETPELLQVLPVVKRFNLPMIAVTGNPESTLGRKSDVILDISIEKEACPLNLAPTASTTNTLVLGDALAIVLMERKGFGTDDFAVFHPAGSLGKRLLLTVEEVMHTGDEIPRIPVTETFRQALLEITSKKLGLTLVVDDAGKTLGIITDGDVRRVLTRYDNIADLTVADVYSPNPKTVTKDALAAKALNVMESHKITALVVNDDTGYTVGIVHLHDLLNTGLK